MNSPPLRLPFGFNDPGIQTHEASALLGGAGTAVPSAGLDLASAAAQLAGAGATPVAGALDFTGFATVTGVSSEQVTGAIDFVVGLTLPSEGTLYPLGGFDVIADALTISGEAGITMETDVARFAEALLRGESDVRTDGSIAWSVTLTQMTAVGGLEPLSSVDLTGVGQLTSAGTTSLAPTLTVVGETRADGESSLLAIGSYWLLGTTTLFTEGNTSAAGSHLWLASLRGDGTTGITALPTREFGGFAQLPGLSEIIGDGVTYQDVGIVVVAMPPPYRVVIAGLDDVPLEEIPARDLQLSWVLNDAGTAEVSLPLLHPKATQTLLDPGKRQLLVYRDSALVWGGYLWAVDAGTSDDEIRLAGRDWFSRLDRRYVSDTLDYNNKDQFDIAWGIIEHVQAQETLGIVRAQGRPSGKTRSIKFPAWERPNAGESLRGLTSLRDGFDFEVTANKKWRTFFPQKGAPLDLAFALGKNIGSLSYTVDADDVTSELTGLGEGDGRDRCKIVVRDPTTLAEYGLLQDSEDFSRVKHYSVLADRTKEAIRLRRTARWQPTMTVVTNDPPWNSYGLGDRPRVQADRGYVQVDRRFKIIAITLAVTDEGREVVQLSFDEELTPREVVEVA